NTATATITVNSTPGAVVITPTSATVCNGSGVLLTGSSTGPGTALSQNFNGGPGSWTVDNTGTTDFDANAPWQIEPDGFVNPESLTFHSPDNSSFVTSNSDHNGSGTTDYTKLVSPVFSLAGYTSATLSFQQFYQVYSGDVTIAVEISINGGLSWNTLTSYL